MGTFTGHFLPGAFFIMFAIHWIFAKCLLFYRIKYANAMFWSVAQQRTRLKHSPDDTPARLSATTSDVAANQNAFVYENLHSYSILWFCQSALQMPHPDHPAVQQSHPANRARVSCCSRHHHHHHPQQQQRAICEPALKISFCAIGIAGEVWTALDSAGNWRPIGNAQHCIMFAAFLVSGLVDLLTPLSTPATSPSSTSAFVSASSSSTSVSTTSGSIAVLPSRTNYVWSAMCFVIEAVLFQFHLHGRSPGDVTLHRLLVIVVWACAASLVLECSDWGRRQFLAGQLRAFLVLLQGCWFITVGALLYPPFSRDQPNSWTSSKTPESQQHRKVMLATVLFGAHVIALFLFQFTIVYAFSFHYHRKIRALSGAAASATASSSSTATCCNGRSKAATRQTSLFEAAVEEKQRLMTDESAENDSENEEKTTEMESVFVDRLTPI